MTTTATPNLTTPADLIHGLRSGEVSIDQALRSWWGLPAADRSSYRFEEFPAFTPLADYHDMWAESANLSRVLQSSPEGSVWGALRDGSDNHQAFEVIFAPFSGMGIDRARDVVRFMNASIKGATAALEVPGVFMSGHSAKTVAFELAYIRGEMFDAKLRNAFIIAGYMFDAAQ